MDLFTTADVELARWRDAIEGIAERACDVEMDRRSIVWELHDIARSETARAIRHVSELHAQQAEVRSWSGYSGDADSFYSNLASSARMAYERDAKHAFEDTIRLAVGEVYNASVSSMALYALFGGNDSLVKILPLGAQIRAKGLRKFLREEESDLESALESLDGTQFTTLRGVSAHGTPLMFGMQDRWAFYRQMRSTYGSLERSAQEHPANALLTKTGRSSGFFRFGREPEIEFYWFGRHEEGVSYRYSDLLDQFAKRASVGTQLLERSLKSAAAYPETGSFSSET